MKKEKTRKLIRHYFVYFKGSFSFFSFCVSGMVLHGHRRGEGGGEFYCIFRCVGFYFRVLGVALGVTCALSRGGKFFPSEFRVLEYILGDNPSKAGKKSCLDPPKNSPQNC